MKKTFNTNQYLSQVNVNDRPMRTANGIRGIYTNSSSPSRSQMRLENFKVKKSGDSFFVVYDKIKFYSFLDEERISESKVCYLSPTMDLAGYLIGDNASEILENLKSTVENFDGRLSKKTAMYSFVSYEGAKNTCEYLKSIAIIKKLI